VSVAPALDVRLVRRLEAHALRAWPATVVEPFGRGWTLRATPGLSRGRSNNALTPCRRLDADELVSALGRVAGFARSFGIRPGIQVSPLELHAGVMEELLARDWKAQWPTLVLGAAVSRVVASGERLAVVFADRADDEWLAAWSACEPARSAEDIAAHAGTVFERLRGRAVFGRFGCEAVGIAVPGDRLAGLFSLAVAPAARRQGLGTGLVRSLLSVCDGSELAYLQVEEENAAGRGLYDRLGFERLYSYVHCVAPAD